MATTKRKPFKPRTWWTIFHNGKPMTHYIREKRDFSLSRFLADNEHRKPWPELQRIGYSVGKIVVSPCDGK